MTFYLTKRKKMIKLYRLLKAIYFKNEHEAYTHLASIFDNE